MPNNKDVNKVKMVRKTAITDYYVARGESTKESVSQVQKQLF